jgi:cellulose synthase/poly-beta-1,6-N-acetylglucosamine synthase-like glycosyltransferase
MIVFTSIAFLILYGCLIFYYRSGWKSILEFTPSATNDPVFVSVIVAARNEEKFIDRLLEAMRVQTYPERYFEVIIVDDYSTDNTAAIVTASSLKNKKLIKPNVDANASSKKKAIEAGILAAGGKLVVTTDADCVPGPRWLETIIAFHRVKGASFIAAPVKYTNDGSMLQSFQALDFLTLQGITAASVALDFHNMCNGANLAYEKDAFNSVNGFEGIDRVATGDDLLLMHKIWKHDPSKVFYLKSKEAIVNTEPMPSWKALLMQRKRWASKSFVYKDYRIITVLIFVYLLNCSFLLLVAMSFFHSFYWWMVAGFWIVKTIIELPFVSAVAKFYNEQRSLRYFFFFQPFHMFFTVLTGLVSQAGRYEWKGRKTK